MRLRWRRLGPLQIVPPASAHAATTDLIRRRGNRVLPVFRGWRVVYVAPMWRGDL